MISVARSSNDELGPGDVAAARRTIRSAGCLVLQLEVPLPAVEAAVRLAHEEGVRVVLNPAPAPLGGLPPPLLQGLFALTPNAQEAAELTGQRAGGGPKAVERAARRLVAAGVEHVLVTCGAAGVCWARRGALRWFPALPVEAVDTVGAGDCFTGTLAVALAERQPMDRAIGFALAAAALCVSRHGAQPAMPRRQEILQLPRHD